MTRRRCAERWPARGASSACRTRRRRASSGKRSRASVLRRWRARPVAAEILTKALGRPIAFAQTPIEQVRHYSKEMALMLEWFERVGYSADIAGLEREFGRALTKLPDWAHRHPRPNGR